VDYSFVDINSQRRKQESKKRQRKDSETATRFLAFLLSLEENELRVLLAESVHAFAFFMIVYASADDAENVDSFMRGDMKTQNLQRSEILMLLEWKEAFVIDGLYKDKAPSQVETRQDSQGDSRRQ
jgi:hypothetical protein